MSTPKINTTPDTDRQDWKEWSPAAPIPEVDRDAWAAEQLKMLAEKPGRRSFVATTTSSGERLMVTTVIRSEKGFLMVDQYDCIIHRHRTTQLECP